MRTTSPGPAPLKTTAPVDAAAQTSSSAAVSSSSPVPSASTNAPADGVDGSGAFHAGRDMRTRVGVNAVTAGSTVTAVPKLLEDWKAALVEAAAEDLAEAEVIAPLVPQALAAAEAAKGEPLTRGEAREVSRDVGRSVRAEYNDAKHAHFKDLTKSPSTKQQTERDVLLAQRPRVDQLRDVFSAAAQQQPGARDNEIVLWENKSAMVVVDTFAPSPKALVVPKDPLQLPIDASRAQLDELALIAAHVSDAFSRSLGSPPAGIWINPPQHLTVKQLHVHVLPDLGPFTEKKPRVFLEDPQTRPQILGFFAAISKELENGLGPAS